MEWGIPILLLLFLCIAAVRDILYQRVSNRLILAGLFLGLGNQVIQSGGWGLFTFLLRSLFPVVLLYLLFLMHALGAGDIKIFSVLSNFISSEALLHCIMYAGITAAVWALIQALYQRTLFPMIVRFVSYIQTAVVERRIPDYEVEGGPGVKRTPFVPMILIGYLTVLVSTNVTKF